MISIATFLSLNPKYINRNRKINSLVKKQLKLFLKIAVKMTDPSSAKGLISTMSKKWKLE